LGTVIKVDNLTKNFGQITAVGGISFDINEGETFGFLGPNGAGKTTTIRMLTGLSKVYSGAGLSSNCGSKRLETYQNQVLGCQQKEEDTKL